jgi:hypothetical protein
MKACVRLCVTLCVLLFLCPGCGHAGATARRITDSEGGRYPLGEIHFVEQNHRAKGVFVAATDGDDNPLSSLWVTKLVPVANSPIPGPTWAREGTVHGQRAHAIVTLPDYRSALALTQYGDSARSRFGQHFVWVLGTNPFVLGLPSAQPQSNWRQAATPSNPWATHFAMHEELNQSVGALVVYPVSFWEIGDEGRHVGMKVSLVTLPQPMRVSEALDAIAAGDPYRLGAAQTVSLEAPAAPPAAQSTAPPRAPERTPARPTRP